MVWPRESRRPTPSGARSSPRSSTRCCARGRPSARSRASYWDNHEDGIYHCAGCGTELFDAGTKFESGTGWPAFTEPKVAEAVELRDDSSWGMIRTEVICRNCGGHLGHVFDDGPRDKGGQRYCMNSCALDFETSPR